MLSKIYINKKGVLSKSVQFSDELYEYSIVGLREVTLRGEPEIGFKLKKI